MNFGGGSEKKTTKAATIGSGIALGYGRASSFSTTTTGARSEKRAIKCNLLRGAEGNRSAAVKKERIADKYRANRALANDNQWREEKKKREKRKNDD